MNRVLSSGWRSIVGCFLAGLLAILPLVLTIAIVMWVTSFMQRFLGTETLLGRGLKSVGLNFATSPLLAYAIGWIFVLAAIFGLGVVINLGAKRLYQRLIDAVITRIPIVGNVYGTSKQLVEMFDRKDEAEIKAMSAVFCTFGKEGGPGVLALMPSPEQFRIGGRDYHVVIIPTAPVPFGGGLMFMPVESVQPANMSVDGLMSIYVSMGVTTPQFLKEDTAGPSPQ